MHEMNQWPLWRSDSRPSRSWFQVAVAKPTDDESGLPSVSFKMAAVAAAAIAARHFRLCERKKVHWLANCLTRWTESSVPSSADVRHLPTALHLILDSRCRAGCILHIK